MQFRTVCHRGARLMLCFWKVKRHREDGPPRAMLNHVDVPSCITRYLCWCTHLAFCCRNVVFEFLNNSAL